MLHCIRKLLNGYKRPIVCLAMADISHVWHFFLNFYDFLKIGFQQKRPSKNWKRVWSRRCLRIEYIEAFQPNWIISQYNIDTKLGFLRGCSFLHILKNRSAARTQTSENKRNTRYFRPIFHNLVAATAKFSKTWRRHVIAVHVYRIWDINHAFLNFHDFFKFGKKIAEI